MEASDVSGSSAGTPPQGWRGGKPPKSSRRGSRGNVKLETLLEPPNGSPGGAALAKQVSDSAGSANIRPLNKIFPPADMIAAPPPQAQAAGAAAAAATGSPDKPPAELAHVLALLSRLLSASAVLVDLQDPPATYIRRALRG